jgi:DNA-directed RNA polymerase specialized sigma subunit
MANSESEKRQLRAQILRLESLIESLEERLGEEPKNVHIKEELRRKKQEVQGLRSELNS